MSNLLKDNIELMKEYNYSKNQGIELDKMAIGTHKKIWWKCALGHEWEAAVNSRSKGHKCPYCANYAAWAGYNDLATINPKLADEWNHEKNGTLKPSDVTPGSHKKVWWRCEKGHEWERAVKDRAVGNGCPYCSNLKALPGYNDLATINPELAKEWDYKRNGELKPEQVVAGSEKKVWWKCRKGHEWQAVVFNRNKGVGCPYCDSKLVLEGFNDLATTNPELAKEWNYEKNSKLKPTNVTAGSNKKAWWKCKMGHAWEASIKSRNRGNSCPYCSNKKLLVGFNDLYFYCVNHERKDLIREFDENKNGFSMRDIIVGSSQNVWWKCPKGHSYQAAAHRRIRTGSGCGVCSHNTLLKNENDLLSTHPEIAKEWDYSKNEEQPDEVMAGSNIKKYWFICPKGHSYEATPLSRKKGSGCPVCAMEKHTSFPEKAIFYYIKKCFADAEENYRDSFLGRMEIDIYIPNYKIGIEYDGLAWHKDHKRDVKKDNACKKNGITLFRIREIGCDDYSSDSVKKYIPPYDMNALKEAVLFIINYINQHYQLSINADIDIDRDRIDILEQVNISEKENSIVTYCPEIKKFWNYEKNGKITPEQISHASMKRAFFKCEKGHEWEAVVSNFANRPWCPYCSGRKALPGFNDLFTTNPELIPFWSVNNIIDPTRIKSGCNAKALWHCPNCGGEYGMKVNQKVKTPGCPYCSGHRVLKEYNDLASQVPDLISDWDYEKNYPLTPNDVTKGSNRKVWWKCHVCNHEWSTIVYDRGVLGRECPACKKAQSSYHNSKPVIQFSLDGSIIAEYNSAAEAERKTGIKAIHKACRNEMKTAGGFIWKYKEKQINS